MNKMERITVYVDHVDSSVDFDWMRAWLAKWERQVRVADYSTGGWEHIWDIEAPAEAVAEIPEDWLCASEWATPEVFLKAAKQDTIPEARTQLQTFIRHRGFAFTPRVVSNALERDRLSLAGKPRDSVRSCGVRQLARIERWLDEVVEVDSADIEVPLGLAAEAIGFQPAALHWFDSLIVGRKYCQAHCSECAREYPKSQITTRWWKWAGIRVRGHGPTGARTEKWQCCPRGHGIYRVQYRVS